jgi:dTMP kinase
MQIASGLRIGPFEVLNPLQPAVSKIRRYGEHPFPGRLIIVEGIDGSGKSTQLSLLHKWLQAKGYGVVFSEWNSSPLVKDTTKHGKKKKMLTPATFSLIHSTDFADRTERSILPLLKGGRGGALRSLYLYRVCAGCGAWNGPRLGA